jgi:hypothetical protein
LRAEADPADQREEQADASRSPRDRATQPCTEPTAAEVNYAGVVDDVSHGLAGERVSTTVSLR